MKTASLRVALGVCGFIVGATACAQAAPPCGQASSLVQVRDFTPVSSGTASHMPGSRLRAARNAMRVQQNATALAEAIVTKLNAKGVGACHLTQQAAPSASGWLVTGEFDETLASGFGAALPSMSSSDKTPNTHVAVQLSNLAASPDAPLARIDTESELKGQKSAAAPKPYGAAARFVIAETEALSSLDDLAGKIADEIAARKSTLENAAH